MQTVFSVESIDKLNDCCDTILEQTPIHIHKTHIRSQELEGDNLLNQAHKTAEQLGW